MVKNLTSQNFETAIKKGVTLVDFWAPWCAPCRMQGPILENVASKIGEKASITKVNVDENPELAVQYGVSGIPSLKIFKSGKMVKSFTGVQRENILVSAINEVLA